MESSSEIPARSEVEKSVQRFKIFPCQNATLQHLKQMDKLQCFRLTPKRALGCPFQQFSSAATWKTTVQRTRGRKAQTRNPTAEELEELERARLSSCLLLREIRCCDIRHSKISKRRTSHISPTTTQASQRSYLNSSMHQFL